MLSHCGVLVFRHKVSPREKHYLSPQSLFSGDTSKLLLPIFVAFVSSCNSESQSWKLLVLLRVCTYTHTHTHTRMHAHTHHWLPTHASISFQHFHSSASVAGNCKMTSYLIHDMCSLLLPFSASIHISLLINSKESLEWRKWQHRYPWASFEVPGILYSSHCNRNVYASKYNTE